MDATQLENLISQASSNENAGKILWQFFNSDPFSSINFLYEIILNQTQYSYNAMVLLGRILSQNSESLRNGVDESTLSHYFEQTETIVKQSTGDDLRYSFYLLLLLSRINSWTYEIYKQKIYELSQNDRLDIRLNTLAAMSEGSMYDPELASKILLKFSRSNDLDQHYIDLVNIVIINGNHCDSFDWFFNDLYAWIEEQDQSVIIELLKKMLCYTVKLGNRTADFVIKFFNFFSDSNSSNELRILSFNLICILINCIEFDSKITDCIPSFLDTIIAIFCDCDLSIDPNYNQNENFTIRSEIEFGLLSFNAVCAEIKGYTETYIEKIKNLIDDDYHHACAALGLVSATKKMLEDYDDDLSFIFDPIIHAASIDENLPMINYYILRALEGIQCQGICDIEKPIEEIFTILINLISYEDPSPIRNIAYYYNSIGRETKSQYIVSLADVAIIFLSNDLPDDSPMTLNCLYEMALLLDQISSDLTRMEQNQEILNIIQCIIEFYNNAINGGLGESIAILSLKGIITFSNFIDDVDLINLFMIITENLSDDLEKTDLEQMSIIVEMLQDKSDDEGKCNLFKFVFERISTPDVYNIPLDWMENPEISNENVRDNDNQFMCEKTVFNLYESYTRLLTDFNAEIAIRAGMSIENVQKILSDMFGLCHFGKIFQNLLLYIPIVVDFYNIVDPEHSVELIKDIVIKIDPCFEGVESQPSAEVVYNNIMKVTDNEELSEACAQQYQNINFDVVSLSMVYYIGKIHGLGKVRGIPIEAFKFDDFESTYEYEQYKLFYTYRSGFLKVLYKYDKSEQLLNDLYDLVINAFQKTIEFSEEVVDDEYSIDVSMQSFLSIAAKIAPALAERTDDYMVLLNNIEEIISIVSFDYLFERTNKFSWYYLIILSVAVENNEEICSRFIKVYITSFNFLNTRQSKEFAALFTRIIAIQKEKIPFTKEIANIYRQLFEDEEIKQTLREDFRIYHAYWHGVYQSKKQQQ